MDEQQLIALLVALATQNGQSSSLGRQINILQDTQGWVEDPVLGVLASLALGDGLDWGQFAPQQKPYTPPPTPTLQAALQSPIPGISEGVSFIAQGGDPFSFMASYDAQNEQTFQELLDEKIAASGSRLGLEDPVIKSWAEQQRARMEREREQVQKAVDAAWAEVNSVAQYDAQRSSEVEQTPMQEWASKAGLPDPTLTYSWEDLAKPETVGYFRGERAPERLREASDAFNPWKTTSQQRDSGPTVVRPEGEQPRAWKPSSAPREQTFRKGVLDSAWDEVTKTAEMVVDDIVGQLTGRPVGRIAEGAFDGTKAASTFNRADDGEGGSGNARAYLEARNRQSLPIPRRVDPAERQEALAFLATNPEFHSRSRLGDSEPFNIDAWRDRGRAQWAERNRLATGRTPFTDSVRARQEAILRLVLGV